MIDLIIDGQEFYQREIWLTAGKGNKARARRLKTVDEHISLIKSRYRAKIATSDSFQIFLTLKSSIDEKVSD
ncbi:hypothetical protein ABDK00_017055 [Niabella insulamsoli]|uniref:hypothetical protein n=1 Tax=Niabella insulamsoli TaxID=3144874 RepID=UPI0031FE2A82